MLRFNNFLKEEDGAGVVELILIIVVLMGVVMIFKEELTKVVEELFKKIRREIKRI